MKWILYLPLDCRVGLTANISEHFNGATGIDQTTSPGTFCPTLYNKTEDAGDGAYRLSSLSEKTTISIPTLIRYVINCTLPNSFPGLILFYAY